MSDAFSRWLSLAEDSSQSGVWPPYRSYRQTWARIGALRRQHPERVHMVRVGTSQRGRPIWQAELPGAGTGANVFVVAGLHAMEHVGVAAAVELLARATTDVVWQGRLSILFLANPDGFMEVEQGLAAGRRGFWRKNARGVDLNRNFATHWVGAGTWSRLMPWFFAAGTSPFSEAETIAVRDGFARSQSDIAISLHAFGNTLYLPWAARAERPPRWQQQLDVARLMIGRQDNAYSIRQLGRHVPFFHPGGTELDYFCSLGALAYLFEIGAGPRLKYPRSWHHPYGWFSPPAPALEADVRRVVVAVEALADVSRARVLYGGD